MQATVLIVDGIVTNRIMLKVQLSAAYYHVVQAERMEGIVALAQRSQPDLIVSAMALPDGGALALRRALQAEPALADIPVLAIAEQNDRAARMRALAEGLDDVLVQPVDDRILQARIRGLLRARRGQRDLGVSRPPSLGFGEAGGRFAAPARVAVLADDAVLGRAWTEALRARGGHRYVMAGTSGIAGLLAAPVADAFVVQIGPEGDRRGFDLLADLRARGASCHAVVIAVIEPADAGRAADALDRGASDVLAEGFNAEELALRLASQLRRKASGDRLRAAVRAGLREAVRDPMTGLYNRRHALPWLTMTARRAAEAGQSVAVMLADLDHFKQINDRYGHLAGDAVLVETARRLGRVLRPQDMLARIGGEEFMLVLPETRPADATAIAGRLCREINSRPFVLAADLAVQITISIGVVVVAPAQRPLADASADRLIAQADLALYRAKGGGRNKVSLIRAAA